MKHFYFQLLLLSLITLNACNNTATTNNKTLSITATNFNEQITEKQNLKFTFNKAVVKEEDLNKWDYNQWLLFDPMVKGAYRWEAPNQIVFSPNAGFQPNTQYKVILNKEAVKSLSSKLSVDENYSTTFTTPKLKVVDATAVWQLKDANTQQSELQVNINFNYEVLSSSFENISATINDKTYSPTISSNGTSKLLQLKTDIPQDITTSEALQLNLGKVYKVQQSENNANVELRTSINIPKPGELIISGHTVEHNGTLGQIFINANQQIEAALLKDYINLSPNVNYNVENTANGIRVFSNHFDISTSYSITIKEGLKGTLAKPLAKEYTAQFTFGYIEPNIKFTSNTNRYLSSAGSKNIAVEIVNIEEVEVSITKVFANNIKTLFNKGSNNRYYSKRDEATGKYEYYNYEVYETKALGKTIYEKNINTQNLEAVGKLRLLKLNFEDILDDYNGLYVVEVKHPKKLYLTSSQIVSLSDIGMITKVGKDAIYVFLNSIKSMQPVKGATVTLYDETNQKLISAPSDGEGVVKFNLKDINMIDPVVNYVEAKTTTDFNFLTFDQSQMNSARFEIGGLRNHESNYQAYIYGERELYRPGETIQLAGIVRSSDIGKPSEIPVVLKCLLPNGQLYKTINKKLNAERAFETALTIPATAPTGNYTFELYTGNSIFIKAHNIKVESFMPDRIKVTTETDKLAYSSGEKIKLNVNAVNFFGPPAKNRNFETEFSLSRAYFSAKNFSEYSFNINNNSSFKNILKEGKTDENGAVNVEFEIPAHYKNIGQLTGKLLTTVFDESGRPVSKANYVDVYTQNIFFGMKRIENYNNVGQSIDLNFIALDKDKNLLNKQPMLVQIMRHYYKTVLEKDSRGRYRYKSYKQTEVAAEETITLNGTNSIFNFTPQESGNYKVLFGHPDNMNEFSFYAYGKGNTNFTAFEVNKEGKINFKKDKEVYEVGDQAKLILSTPFQGKILVTVERDNIIKHYYTTTDKRSAELTIDITPEMFPNAYITTTLIKPVKDSNIPLTVAYGIENITVINPQKNIAVNIEAQDKIRSNQSYTFTVNSEPNTEITVAVVDEGILNITNYKSPNATNYFYQKRALEVEAYDLYPYLFPEITDRGLLIGGGSVEELNNRAVGFGNKRVQLCSFWSGIVQTNELGQYQMTIDVPEFSGDLRLMAMSYKGDRFGATQANIKVADPIILSTGLPRFLTPGDEVDIPVMLSNTTANVLQNEIKIDVEGPLELIGDAAATVKIDANNEQQLWFKAKVLNALGDAKVTVNSLAGGEIFSSTTNLVVRPASPLQKTSGFGSIKANTSETLNLENEFLPNTLEGKITITQSPIAEFGDKLSYLLKYPHGCLEQRISKVIPLIGADELMQAFDVDLNNEEQLTPQHWVQTIIYDIQTLQTGNGGMAYWRSGGRVHWWASVYAAHFLSEAKKAGYDVNPVVLDKLISYIKQKNSSKETTLYYYQNSVKTEKVRREIPYGLMVLALVGEADISLMNYYKSYPKLLTEDAKYMIGAAYALLGDKEKFRAMVPASFSGKKALGELDGSFSSYIRDLAISLYALAEVEPENAQIPAIAKKLSEAFKNKEYYNTQEAAFTILALSKVAKLYKNDAVEAEIFADDKLVATFTGNENVNLDIAAYQNQTIKVVTKGQGQLYYFYEVSGFTDKNEVEEKDNFLAVRKNIYDRNGNKADLNNIKQNDLLVIELALRSKDKNIENVVLTDVLPAGFEIENPRINETATLAWQKHQGTYDHIDFRDDRVNIYTTAYTNNSNNNNTYKYRNYYYTVRAVSKGTYVMGPASADAMYNGEYYSYNGGGLVEVE